MKQAFSKLAKEFTSNLDVMENSRALYLRHLNQFAKWIVVSGKNVKVLKRSDILEYKSYMLKQQLSENTIDSYLSTVRQFFEWLENIGEHENIAAGIKIRHKKIGFRKEHLNISEIAELYSMIDRSTLMGMRDYAIVNLMLRSGMRCVEVSRIRVCDIDVRASGCSVLLQRKGDVARTDRLGLPAKAYEPIRDYLSFRGVSDEKEYVFLSHGREKDIPLSSGRIGKIAAHYMKMAGIYSKMKTAHSLRHTAAVQAILNKVPIKEVQLMLGHKRVETTELYLRSIDAELRLSNPAAQALSDAF